MWIGFNEQQQNFNSIFLIMGKGLRLCQNLEVNIKHIISIVKIEEGIKSGEIKEMFDKKWNNVVDQIEKYFLNNNIQQLNKTGMLSNEVIEKLENGRKARNRIIHDSIMILSGSIHKGRIQDKELEEYLKEIENVAKADNIVSGWIWQINEKIPPCKTEKQYIKEINDWINKI